jgi:hypothetical protein
MTRDEIFEAWAPRDAVWSTWAKPVLFAHLPRDVSSTAATTPIDPQPLPFPPTAGTAIVLDLPGAAAIPFALDLASRGHRPVPLYNACPASAGETEVVPVRPILDALAAGAAVLRERSIAPDAPPVFLLDADRRGLRRPKPAPGEFDSRSVSLPTDFPSAAFLASQSVRRVLLVQSDELVPQPDLAHTLRRYEQAGIELASIALSNPARPPTPMRVPRPPFFGFAFQRFLAVMGLHRNPLGGFGGTLPEPSNG